MDTFFQSLQSPLNTGLLYSNCLFDCLNWLSSPCYIYNVYTYIKNDTVLLVGTSYMNVFSFQYKVQWK